MFGIEKMLMCTLYEGEGVWKSAYLRTRWHLLLYYLFGLVVKNIYIQIDMQKHKMATFFFLFYK